MERPLSRFGLIRYVPDGMQRPKMRFGIVRWVDSHSEAPWRSLGNIDEGGLLMDYYSVGWIMIHDDEKSVTVTPHVAVDEGKWLSGTGTMTIPSCAILDLKFLDVPGIPNEG